MKYIILIPFLILLSSCSLFNRSSDSEKKPALRSQPYVPKSIEAESTGVKKRLMILPFLDSSSERPQSLRDNARKEVIQDLNRTRQLIVVDSSEVQIDLTQDLKEGEYQLAQIAPKAATLGVGAILEGKVLNLRIKRKSEPVGIIRQVQSEFESIVRIRIVTARQGRELLNLTKTVTLTDSNYRVAQTVDSDRLVGVDPQLIETLIRDAFLEFTPQIMAALSKMDWEGRIAAVRSDRIFLNVGQISGLKVGDILKVSDEGETIYDPETGQLIGKVPGRMKGTLEVISFYGNDGSIAIVHSGAGFKENDRVELY